MKLKELRDKAKLTQVQLAHKAGLYYLTIYKIEKGHTPSLTTLKKIAKALNVHVKELL